MVDLSMIAGGALLLMGVIIAVTTFMMVKYGRFARMTYSVAGGSISIGISIISYGISLQSPNHSIDIIQNTSFWIAMAFAVLIIISAYSHEPKDLPDVHTARSDQHNQVGPSWLSALMLKRPR